ncbi:hypothetical protein BFN03_00100 [Rhodococcus sp. WMMA185]|uniref:Ig-like domain-containing protein n=1 Tax=Rhodococcus sp. WMMA185 TaxID=679318 RepID=UPI000878440F|nr:Ig-like domain-containing protein [Rhodococcus sp. WMMA185]AOW91607.1 hypothetical protein BFN03_00100 [Rhodococcus sp. WMMA185]
MFGSNIRRAVGAVVAAAALVATVGAGPAGAKDEDESVSWTDGMTKITRTVSNAYLRVDDTVTVTTKLEKKFGGVTEFIYEVTDVHPACLMFDSAKLDGKSFGVGTGADWVRFSSNRIKWPIHPVVGTRSRTFEVTYKVGSSCERNVELDTGMRYVSNLVTRKHNTKGPAILVGLDTSKTEFRSVPTDAQVGESVPLDSKVTGGNAGETVELYDGATKIGTAVLNRSGVALFDWTPDREGAHTLTSKYPGNSHTRSSQSSFETVQVWAGYAETATVLRGPATAQTGTEVIFGSQVSPTPEGGTVQFRDGFADLGTPVPVDADGRASITHTFDSAGTHNVTAVYGGAPGYVGSTSEALTVTVTDNDGDGGTDDGGNTDGGGPGSPGNIFGS